MTRYLRIIVLFSVSFACVAINFWLIRAGHYTAPLFVLLGCIFGTPFILRRLPPVTTTPQEIRGNQERAGSALRRMGFLYIGGFAMGVFLLVSGEFKDLPVWGRILLFCWSGFLIWVCFSRAKRLKKVAAGGNVVLPTEPKS
jgi:hypothetical protein